jgi:malate synthase
MERYFGGVPKYRFVMVEVAHSSVCKPSDTAAGVGHNRTIILDYAEQSLDGKPAASLYFLSSPLV